MIQIREAQPSDLVWINAKYDEIGFARSELPRDAIVVAEVAGSTAGRAKINIEKL